MSDKLKDIKKFYKKFLTIEEEKELEDLFNKKDTIEENLNKVNQDISKILIDLKERESNERRKIQNLSDVLFELSLIVYDDYMDTELKISEISDVYHRIQDCIEKDGSE